MIRRAAYLARMLLNEARSPAALSASQSRQLRSLVRYSAARVPFYRDLYAAHGVDPATFRGLPDLSSLPMVDKRLMRAAGGAILSLDAPSKLVTIRTSGSTGEPFTFQVDQRHDQWRKAQCLRPYVSNGRRLRDKVLRLTAFPIQRTPWFSRLGLLRETQLHCSTEPRGVVAAWRRYAPDILQGYPADLRALAHYCLEAGEPLRPAPRLIFSDSGLMLPDTRALIARAFGISATDIFGTFESDNTAFECAVHNGYHIASDSVILEIVQDGKPVRIGEAGELVVTVLGNRTSPFIRYNLKDIGRLSAQPCPCGLAFPLLSVIEGRANDLLRLPGGRTLGPSGALVLMTQFADAIIQYQLRQLAIGHFELFIVPSNRFAQLGPQPIIDALRSQLGAATIELRLVAAIAPDRSGKLRAFISQLVDHAEDRAGSTAPPAPPE
jgi:phenylacetate-CoA ligase